ncbi:GntR family transcriptional regulator [Roseibium sp.]|uniref:GntR family transcriptional regulator n=1 Tax=Roseibium sp. TaxID=1936156 RepID=UPI003A97827B
MSSKEFQIKKPGISPIDVSTVQERVYQSLRLALLKGEFMPGEQVSTRGLAQAFGTSPMPVRDALARLVAEKALEQPSPRVLRVPPYEAADHEEYIRIRMQLEGYATERASRANPPGLIGILKSHNEQFRAALDDNNIEQALAENHALHFAIYNASGYTQLVDMISSLWLRTGPILASAQKNSALFERLFRIGYDIHNDVIAGIECRNHDAVRRAMLLDIRSTHFSIRHYFKTLQEQEGS